MVELSGIVRTFSAHRGQLIEALSLERLRVERGEALAVVGPNGCGKTTLLNLVAGLLRPDEGTVTVAGTDLTQLKEHQLDRFRARNIGYLIQGGGLLESLTARENVRAALLFGGWDRKTAHQRCDALLEQLGISQRADHRPGLLSSGERQRAALACALANDPALILADEPTSNLDPETAEVLTKELVELCREDKTLLVVTHHLHQYGDRVRTLNLSAASSGELHTEAQ